MKINDIKRLLNLKSLNIDSFIAILALLFFVGFAAPTIFFYIPHGTDSYTHLFYTRIFYETNSIEEFYNKLQNDYFTKTSYPFGFRLFSSLVMKISSIDAFSLSILQPLILLMLSSLLYYIYSKELIPEKDSKVHAFSVLFMLSMPVITIGILNFETDSFMFPFVILIFTLLLVEKPKQLFILTVLLCLTPIFHAGTYLFLFSFFLVYIIVYSVIYNRIPKAVFSFSAMLLSYVSLVNIFPEIHPQFGTKALFILRISDKIAGITGLNIFRSIGDSIYGGLFSEPSLINVFYAVIALYFLSILATKVSTFVKNKGTFSFAIAFATVPKSPIFLPFWIGPLQTLLSLLSLKRVDKKITSILIPLLIIVLPSAMITGERGLREIQYLFLIIPILSTLGFLQVVRTIKEKISSERIRGAALFFAFFSIFLSFGIISVFGNAYYHPKISIPQEDKFGLEWLRNVGSEKEGVGEIGYGHRVSVYASKIPPSAVWIPAGKEMRRYLIDYSKAVVEGDIDAAKDLSSSFGAKYLIVSSKTLKGLKTSWKEINLFDSVSYDKILSSKEFAIARFIEEKLVLSDIHPEVQLEEHPTVKDAGNFLLVETKSYKIRVGKTSPKIDYLGTKTENYLEEGSALDYVIFGKIKGEIIQGVEFSKVLLGENIVEYRGEITKDYIPVATLIVRYTFYPEAVKKEVTVFNDYNNIRVPVKITTRFYAPYTHFTTLSESGEKFNRTIYPNEDYVLLRDLEFREIFVYNEQRKGIYLSFEKTSPLPDRISYSGSTKHKGYSRIDFSVKKDLTRVYPGERVTVTQWISVGEENKAKMRIENSSFVNLHPYVKKPAILIVKFKEDVNDSILQRIESLNFPVVLSIPLHKQINIQKLKNYSSDNFQLAAYLKIRNDTIREEYYKNIPNISKFYPVKAIVDPYANLRSIMLFEEYGIRYVFNRYVSPPYLTLFDEGERFPTIAVVRGKETNVTLLPISSPTLSAESSERGWREVENIVRAIADSNEIIILEVEDSVFYDNSSFKRLQRTIDFLTKNEFEIVKLEEVREELVAIEKMSVNISGKYPENFTVNIYSKENLPEAEILIKLSIGDFKISAENAKIEKRGSVIKAYLNISSKTARIQVKFS
ncbi:hypothetical protein Ferp_1909 [Ferroglobus placidus DSM 10642]|uniref:Uncharacterized protein n=1 Tax=Ferroglobus placidus (strain DSM 10642 / AEDII12DO) TaxID=589924 RepID=D3RZY6_FERPA|nr:hypothetical protein [Ferroglobus placidus]ADC66049.1 hypothetical protein Ferp_1909 [Ferroglobus placidus DSM 10642]